MALTRLTKDMAVISALADNPRADGLTTEAFKGKFDEAAEAIKAYINDVLVPAIESINSVAIAISDTKPDLAPALWFDTSGDYPLMKYIDTYGFVSNIYPVTKVAAIVVTVPASGWNSAAPYTQTVSVDGMKPNWIPGAYTMVSSGVIDTDLAAQEAAGYLTWIESGTGTLTFVCGEDKPEKDFTLRIPGVMEVSNYG